MRVSSSLVRRSHVRASRAGSSHARAGLRAFTLVEILIVVVILGVLASIVVPQFAIATQESRVGAAASSLRGFERGFIMYYADNLSWPGDRGPGVFPPAMDGYLREDDWLRGPALGEDWDWNIGNSWTALGPNISMRSTGTSYAAEWLAVDELMDDGDTADGLVQRAQVGGHHLLLRIR